VLLLLLCSWHAPAACGRAAAHGALVLRASVCVQAMLLTLSPDTGVHMCCTCTHTVWVIHCIIHIIHWTSPWECIACHCQTQRLQEIVLGLWSD
jgi:hypothetical protein